MFDKTGMSKFSQISVQLKFTFIAFIIGTLPPSSWSASEDAHSVCLDAQDYQGCVLVQKCMKAKDISGCIESIKTKTGGSNQAPIPKDDLDFLGKRKNQRQDPL